MRTTNDKKDSTIILRINEDTRSYLESESSKGGVSMSQYIREVIEKSKTRGNVIQNNPLLETRIKELEDENAQLHFQSDLDVDMTVIRDIETMVGLSGGTLKGFLNDLDMKLEWNELTLEDGVVKIEKEPSKETLKEIVLQKELENLKDACEAKNMDVNKVVRDAAQKIWG